MAETKSKLSAPLQKFASDLKATLIKAEGQIREMRALEASTKERKLAKNELCPLCGGPDVNGKCACLDSLKKNAMLGYGGDSAGPADGMGQTPGGAGGGGGGEPMGMAEGKMEKGALCKGLNCNKAFGHLGKCSMDDVTSGKDLSKDEVTAALAKKAPPGEEKLVHKLKDEYGHDEEGKRKAFATAWAVKNGTVKKTMDGDMAGGAMGKAALPMGHSSSAAAQAAVDPMRQHPYTGAIGGGEPYHIADVNHELGGFKSIAGSHPIAPGHLMPSTKINVGTAGRRAGNVQAPVSGVIPNAKSEKNPGSARSPYGTGAAGHATQTNMPSALKDNMAPVKKDELPATKAVPEAAVKGAKAPKKGKNVTPDKQGSGGEIEGNPLKKEGMSTAYQKKIGQGTKGVSGKQPVGQGGGDAHKVAHGAKAPLPMPAKGASPFANAKPAAKPIAGPPAGAPKGQLGKPVGPLAQRMAGAKPQGKLGALRAAAGVHGPAGQGRAPLPSTDIDVSEFAEKPKDALGQLRDKMNLAADKKAGGVGFLRGLFSMFHSPKPAPAQQMQQGSATSQRFHGARPLQRSEEEYALPLHKSEDMGACIFCHNSESKCSC